MSRIIEDRTEDSRLPLLSHLMMGLSFILSSSMLTYGTFILLTYRDIKLLISGLEEIIFSLSSVGLSCTGGSFVVLYIPDRDVLFCLEVFLFTERDNGFSLVGLLGVASCGDMTTELPLLLLVGTCSEVAV